MAQPVKRFWVVGLLAFCQVGRSLLGDWGRQELVAFWNHLMGLEEWSDHPILHDSNVDIGSRSLSFWMGCQCSIMHGLHGASKLRTLHGIAHSRIRF